MGKQRRIIGTLAGALALTTACTDPADGSTDTDPGSSGPGTGSTTAGVDPTTNAANTSAVATTSTTTTSATATEGGETTSGSETGSEPPTECTDERDCPGSTICDPTRGVCVCNPDVAFCLSEVPPGHWVELEGTPIEDVFPPLGTVPGNPRAVTAAWSGGVFDSRRNAMVLWGGGHADYAGNEVYSFDLDTLTWTRLNEPSLDVGGDESTGYYPDGLPRSRHSYDYLAYAPEIDALCSMGSSAMYPSGQMNTTNLDCFDLETLTWSAYAPAPAGTIAGIADYDPVSGRVAYVAGPQLRYLAQWSVDDDSWMIQGDGFTNGGLGLHLTGRVDPMARRFVAAGSGNIYAWDLDTRGFITETALELANEPPDFDQRNPGLAYSDTLGRLVWWGRSDSVWSMDLDTMSWEEHPVADDNTVSAPEPVLLGTYGRFRYSPHDDLFVLVNEHTDNVFVRRL